MSTEMMVHSVWNGLNNQSYLFNVLKKNIVQYLTSEKIIRIQGKCPTNYNDVLFRSYVRKNNKMLITNLQIESEKFNIISGKISNLIAALKQLHILDKENAIILLKMDLYSKIPDAVFGQCEYFAKGTFPGTTTGFITASFNNISIFPLKSLAENTIYLIDNDSFFLNLVEPTRLVDGILVTEMELICSDYSKQYKITLE